MCAEPFKVRNKEAESGCSDEGRNTNSSVQGYLYKCFRLLGEVRLQSKGKHLPTGDSVRPHVTLVGELARLNTLNGVPEGAKPE